jgi:hypothetical protein
MRVLSTRWLMRGRCWAVSTPVRARVSRNEALRNLDKAYPLFREIKPHIGAFRGVLKRIGTMRQNFAASKSLAFPELRASAPPF